MSSSQSSKFVAMKRWLAGKRKDKGAKGDEDEDIKDADDVSDPSNCRAQGFGSDPKFGLATLHGHAGERTGPRLEFLTQVGIGTFGTVRAARLLQTGEVVAVKTVLQTPEVENRELEIMKKLAQDPHSNVVLLLDYFFTDSAQGKKNLNLVLEYQPNDLSQIMHECAVAKMSFPPTAARVYMYQVARGLRHLHRHGIGHRDVKPANILVNPATQLAQICDLGSAKVFVKGGRSVPYMCSRWYRAPELHFQSQLYTCKIDMWSYGCIAAELASGVVLFQGNSSAEQIADIMSVLGCPSRENVIAMNCELDLSTYCASNKKPVPLEKVLGPFASAPLLDLLAHLICYDPAQRFSAEDTLAHPFFLGVEPYHAQQTDGMPTYDSLSK